VIRTRALLGVVVLVSACSGAVPSPSGPASLSSVAAYVPASVVASASLSSSGPTGSPQASPAIDLPAIVPVETIPGVVAVTDIGEPDWLSIAGDSVWAAGVEPGIGRFDLATAKQRTGVDAGGVCLGMDVAFDSLWVGDCAAGTLLRIDPATGTIRVTIKLPGVPNEESSVAAGEGAVWITAGSPPALIRIDPKTNKVTTTVDTPALVGALRAGAGGLWYISAAGNVLRLDPKTGATVKTIAAGQVPRFTAIGAGSVWVLNQADGTVSRIDGKTNDVTATVVVSGQSIEGGDMAFGGGFAWARVSDALVAQIDPATNRVVRRIGDPAGSGSVAANDGAVWISAHDVHTIWRVPLQPA
jgi:virginiamycin B lyase